MSNPLRVLLVKTSSLGDVIHTLPAVTDAMRAVPGIRFDWVVEEGFSEIPAWHPAVGRVLPVAIRRWRKNLRETWRSGEWGEFKARVRDGDYDLAIDAQGLVKSAFLVRLAKCRKVGPDAQSAREPFAARTYTHGLSVPKGIHAVQRLRILFAQALAYPVPDTEVSYGVDFERLPASKLETPYVVFLHATTWATKHWPEAYWIRLARLAGESGMRVQLPWGNAAEQERARRIAAASQGNAEVLPAMTLSEIAGVLARATAVIAVDTGLCHLAAAMNTPTISLYGPTNPGLTGAEGRNQVHMASELACAPCMSRKCKYRGAPMSDELDGRSFHVIPPCFATLNPDRVWAEAEQFLR